MILRVLHIWQPRDGFPQYTMTTDDGGQKTRHEWRDTRRDADRRREQEGARKGTRYQRLSKEGNTPWTRGAGGSQGKAGSGEGDERFRREIGAQVVSMQWSDLDSLPFPGSTSNVEPRAE